MCKIIKSHIFVYTTLSFCMYSQAMVFGSTRLGDIFDKMAVDNSNDNGETLNRLVNNNTIFGIDTTNFLYILICLGIIFYLSKYLRNVNKASKHRKKINKEESNIGAEEQVQNTADTQDSDNISK